MRRYVLKLGDSEIQLAPGTWRIGRDPACEIRLTDESVSRRHAVMRVTDTGVEVSDQGSRNGVRINGDRVYGRGQVQVGDRIEVGVYALELAEPGTASSAQAATRPLPKLPKTGLDSLELLSKREREVFERLARGETQRAVAEELGLSVKTVETYRARIRDKLGLHSRADLVQFALEAGILRPGSA